MARFGVLATLALLATAAGAQVWVKTGGPPGGIGYDVRVRADNPNLMYATDNFAGVHISTDGGRTWTASNRGILARAGLSGDAIPIFTLTVDPHDANVIWAGTRNARGVYKSVDGGKTWVEKTRGIVERNLTFRGITVDPVNRNVVYVAGELPFSENGPSPIGRRFALSRGFVYRSANSGDDWTRIWVGDNLARYVFVDPRNSDVLYVSTGFFDVEAANADPQRDNQGGVGILKSVDGGKTWRALNKANGLMNLYVGSLAMDPRNPDILLAATGGDGGYSERTQGVYRSSDGGETWTLTGSGKTAVDFSPANSNIAYAADAGVFHRSEDGGRTWRLMSGVPGSGAAYGPPGMRTGIPVDIQVDPRDPDRVFLNNYSGGNFLTEDGGRTWTVAAKGYTGAQINVVASDPADPRRLFAGGRSGIFRTDDAGTSWLGVNYGLVAGFEFTAIAVHPSAPRVVLAGDEDNGMVFRSDDSGRSWQLVFQQPGLYRENFTNRHGFKTIVFAPSDPNTVYAGMRYYQSGVDGGRVDPSYGVLKSADGGQTWRYSNDAAMSGQNVNVICVDPRNENIVYAGTIAGGVFRSGDGGKSWAQSSRGLRTLDVRALVIDPANPAVLYAGLESAGIYKSTDAGASWQLSSAGLDPKSIIRALVVGDSGILYAAELHTGVYRSVDGGRLWTSLATGLTTRAVKSLALSGDGGALFAGTDGEGVFRLDLMAAAAEPAPRTVSAASFADAALAPDSIATLFGRGLASATQTAASLPLPTALAETVVTVIDSSGAEQLAPLFFVSPGQINCLIPAGLKPGPAVLRVLSKNRVVARGQLRLEAVAPGLFTANSDGQGAPAAAAIRISAGGVQTAVPVFRCGAVAASCLPEPIDVAEETILLLFGTGIRGYSSRVSATIGGIDAPVVAAQAQGEYAGLDQVNVRIPRELAGRGEVDVALTVDGRQANLVRIRVQ